MTSIRRSIVIYVSLGLLLVSSVVFAGVYFAVQYTLRQQFDADLRTRAEAIASLVEFDHGKVEIDVRGDAIQGFVKQRHASYFQVSDSSGHPLIRSDSLGDETLALQTSDYSGNGVTRDLTLPDHHEGRVTTIHSAPTVEEDDPANNPPPKVPPILVSVASGTHPMDESLEHLAVAMASAVALVVVAMWLLVPRLVRRGLAPLEAMSTRAAAIDPDRLSEQFSTDLPAELVPIARGLNLSMKRLADAFERERRFSANAAHELRTPLAAIRTSAEVALKWPDAEQRSAEMSNILVSAIRMQRLIDQLMTLARVYHGQNAMALEAMDLHELIEQSIRLAEPVGAQRNVSIRREGEVTETVRSNAELLQSLLDNIIVNAARHAMRDTSISVHVLSTEPPHVVVENQTDDLGPDDLTHLFEPLWTKSADRSAGNAGLGLALVAEYARLLNIVIEPSLNRQTFKMTLRFPPAGSATA